MLSNMSLQQLADIVNEKLNQVNLLTSSDKRYSAEVTPRRIRDYISQGLLEKPFKNGKLIYFTEIHVNKLIALRTMQSDGLSDKYMKKLSDYNEPEINQTSDIIKQQETFALIASIKDNTMKSKSTLSSYSLLGNNNNIQNELKVLSRPKSKTWIEIPLDMENKCFLKLESGANLKNKEDILKTIKEILNL